MKIKKWKKEKALVSIRHTKTNKYGIQGFILGFSKELLLLQYVYDFNLDGLMVLRRSDIFEMKVSKTDVFQKNRLIEEGLFQQVDFSVNYSLHSWPEFIKSAMQDYTYFIFEEELKKPAIFNIGKIKRIENNKVYIKYFTGIARWLKKPVKIKYSNLTSCQIGNNYLNVYERYFNRKTG